MRKMKIAMKLSITGLVHGVFFRASLSEYARSLGVSGWVRNLGDGSVEAFVEGEEDNVRKVVAWANRGPPRARVDAVRSQEATVRHLKGFMVVG